MLEAPDLQNAQIIGCLEAEYGLSVTGIAFLPIGVDVNTAVYRVVTEDARHYFLKLRRRDFSAETVTIPHWLAEAGMQPLIPPVASRITGALWSELGSFTVILYPFVSGSSGWEVNLSQQQWIELGAGLSALHTAAVPPELMSMIPREAYSSVWRDRVTAFLRQATDQVCDDPITARLADLLNEKRAGIRHIVARAEQLSHVLVRQPPEHCLCHGDFHAGNILVDTKNDVYIVDWDTLILAPRERDLMFIGGGVGGVWNRDHEVKWFYQGYGETYINMVALAYYRYERIVQDIGEICTELLVTNKGGDDRAAMLEQFVSQFEPGNVVEIACVTDQKLNVEQ